MEDYLGYKTIQVDDAELAELYSDLGYNRYECLVNEYLVVTNTAGAVVDKFKWTGKSYAHVSFKNISNDYTGKISPRNLQQELAFEMLQDQDVTVKVLTGRFGTGKDFIMISHALDLIMKKHKYDKIVWIRNNVEVKNSNPIGFLPGSLQDKLAPYAMIIADHVGGMSGFETLVGREIIELQHLGLVRGRDIKNAIIICSEAENLTKEHVQLLLGRVGQGSCLWINGDYKQVDKAVFATNNGLLRAIDKLKGHKLFGYVRLDKIERSETASMADLLDD